MLPKQNLFLKLILLACYILLLNAGLSSNNFALPIIDKNIRAKRTGTQQINPSLSEEPEINPIYTPLIVNIAAYNEISLPSFESFAKSLENGQKEIIRGVYIQDILALRVVQQPDGDPTFIDDAPDSVTQFDKAAQFGTIGLLAHNDRAGMSFYKVKNRQHLTIIYGDGSTNSFRVTDIKQYQALDPYDPYGNFLDLTTGKVYSSTELFRLVYLGNEHLILQTCLENQGILTWGRYFVHAEPATKLK